MKLNLGCGKRIMPKEEGWVNLDRFPHDGVDVVHNTDEIPWPFEGEEFDYVLASHFLEHVVDIGKTMREIYRVLKVGGTLKVIAPYGLDKLYDPFHYHAFDMTTMNYFTRADSSLDAAALFQLRARKITDYSYPFKWHLNKYLGIRDLPIGRRNEVTFWLIRV